MSKALPLLVFALHACEPTYLAGGQPEIGEFQAGDSCSATVRTVSPASDGQTNFYFRDDVIFSVTEGAETAQIIVKAENGDRVEGTTWVDESSTDEEAVRVFFTPDEPLQPETEHKATLRYCGGSPSVQFRTSSLGLPIDNPALLSGWTYNMDLSKARVEKPGIAAQALLTLVDDHLALQVNGLYEDALDVTIAPTDARTNEQNTCIPTLHADMPNNFSSTPTFVMGPIDVPVSLAGYEVTLYKAKATATFAADGSFFAGGTIAGSLDARDLARALAGRDILPSDSPEAVCDVIANAKLPCTECQDGEPYCLYLEVREVSGHPINTVLQPIEQLNCDVDCPNSCENDACEKASFFPDCMP